MIGKRDKIGFTVLWNFSLSLRVAAGGVSETGLQTSADTTLLSSQYCHARTLNTHIAASCSPVSASYKPQYLSELQTKIREDFTIMEKAPTIYGIVAVSQFHIYLASLGTCLA